MSPTRNIKSYSLQCIGYRVNTVSKMLKHQNITETRSSNASKAYNLRMIPCHFFCLHRFALSTNPRITPAKISRYRLIRMSVLLISRQPMKLQISFGFARAMPTTNPRTGMLWERDCEIARKLICKQYVIWLPDM